MTSLVGPPCIHCGLTTFANPCVLMAYGLESTVIRGFAVECFLCKAKGPFADTPQGAIQRYSPWVSFKQRKPLEGQNVTVWDEEFDCGGSIKFSNKQDGLGRYDAVRFTHWTPMFPRPATYHRVSEEVPEYTLPDEPPGARFHRDDLDEDVLF